MSSTASTAARPDRYLTRAFPALGGTVTVETSGDGAGPAGLRAEAAINEFHNRLTRFDPASELSRLNSDPRDSVPASALMLRFASLVGYAGELSRGLVDATCLDALEQAGYTRSLGAEAVGSDTTALALTPDDGGRPAGPDPRARWRIVSTDPERQEVTRPPGLRLDPGGIGKGLAADVAAEELADCDSYAVNCLGDIRFGGRTATEREIAVASPLSTGDPVARLVLDRGAVATSGVTRRTWIDSDGRPAHHLIDPRTGRPANTGVLQATAVAPTGVEAEVRVKSALLSGASEAGRYLAHGGVVVLVSGEVIVFGDRAGLVGGST
jgi:thiamine biosynthesis lipoprotein